MGIFSRLFSRADESLRRTEPAAASTGGLLHDLDELTAQKRWPEAVVVLERLAAEESDDTAQARERRSNYLHAAANITQYELGAQARAVELLERAIAANPSNTKARERLAKLGRRL
jgi:hypothetical protein